MQENTTLEFNSNIFNIFGEYPQIMNRLTKNIKFLQNFYFDKVKYNKKTNIFKKIEIYNFIPRKNIKKIIKYLNTKQFKYLNNTKDFPKIFNILLNQENKHINGKGKIFENTQKLPKYYYYVDFVKVLNHRGRPLLLKIYRNKAQNREYSKIEITYIPFKKSYNLYFLDFLNALKGIGEVLKRISNKNQFYAIDEEMDFSKRIYFHQFIEHILKLKNKYNKKYNQKIKSILIGK